LPELAGAARAAALRFAEALTRACAAALVGDVAAVILHGSLTLGDYVPAAATSTCWWSSSSPPATPSSPR
jgi:hypothetical protein